MKKDVMKKIINIYIVIFCLLSIYLFYIAYNMILGKPTIVNIRSVALIMATYIIWNPYRFNTILQLSASNDSDFSWAANLSPIFFQALVYIAVVIIFAFLYTNKYYFFNIKTKDNVRIIVEEALDRIVFPMKT